MKSILVTGGTGSFGQALTKIILEEHNPKVVRIFSRGEFLQQQMNMKFNDKRLYFLIGDVRDESRLYRAMNGVGLVIHAAALKQVPTCEYNPIEAVRTNIQGAINVINAAIENKVEKVIAISSDKACQPVNLYGATKMIMEKLLVQANAYGKTRFSCVRYGNVIGSRGSIIPIFKEQAKTGTITITDKRMTRFWITLEQGVRFVLNCLDRMKGGEIFIPKIPSMRIIDLAEVIAPGVKQEVIGIRPGEKLTEILITKDEARHTREFDNYFIIQPEFPFWTTDTGKQSPMDFEYRSDNNQWLDKETLSDYLQQLP